MYREIKLVVRRFREEDAQEVSNLMCRNFREVNIKDYGVETVEELCASHHAEWVKETARDVHMYVALNEEKIAACGSISSFNGSLEESYLMTVFVLPQLHGLGIGRRIIEVLEQDEYFLRAKRIELAASITAYEFYRKLGYDFKDGKKELDADRLYHMEKFRKIGETI